MKPLERAANRWTVKFVEACGGSFKPEFQRLRPRLLKEGP